MNRTAAALVLALVTFSIAEAKPYEGAGVVVGVGSSTLGSQLSEAAPLRRVSLQAGVMVDVLSSYLRIELHYLERGQYRTTDGVDEYGVLRGTLRDDFRAEYLTVPVMARFIADLKPADVFLTAGPRLDVLLKYWDPGSLLGGPVLSERYFAPVNIGANWGIGAAIAARNVTIIPEVRMSYTFNDVYRYRASNLSLYPTSLELVVGFRF
jgi:hypothetical protein